jgi:O-antigen/teichoic acid export membrane protein
MLKASFAYFSIRVVNGVLALASISLLSRLLTPEQYGAYALGVAGIMFCGSVLFQWLAVGVSRFHARYSDSPDALIGEALRLFSYIAFCAAVVTVAVILWSPSDRFSGGLVIATAAGAIFMGLHSLGLQIANARSDPLRYGLLTFSRAGVALLAAVLLVNAGFGAVGAVSAVALGNIAAVFLFARQNFRLPAPDRALRQKLVKYGLPLTLTYMATMVLDVSDRFLIGWWLGPSYVAGYAAAYDLSQQTVGAFLNVFFLAMYPKITTMWENGGVPAARAAMSRLFNAFGLGVPLVGGFVVGLSPAISQVVFGEGIRQQAQEILPWIAVAACVGCLKSFFLDIAFQVAEQTGYQLRITAFMALTNVGLNCILIPEFGVLGAALSTVVALLLGTGLSWHYGRAVGIYAVPFRTLANMVLVFIAVSGAMRMVSSVGAGIQGAMISLLVGIAVYSTLVLLTNLGGVRTLVGSFLCDR